MSNLLDMLKPECKKALEDYTKRRRITGNKAIDNLRETYVVSNLYYGTVLTLQIAMKELDACPFEFFNEPS